MEAVSKEEPAGESVLNFFTDLCLMMIQKSSWSRPLSIYLSLPSGSTPTVPDILFSSHWPAQTTLSLHRRHRIHDDFSHYNPFVQQLSTREKIRTLI